MITKKQSLTLSADQVTVAKKIDQDLYDAWDKESNDYHSRYSRANTFAGSGSSYGLSDLNYYGSFINGGGMVVSGSLILLAQAGIPIKTGCGRYILGRVTPGSRPIHGDGCHIIRARGPSTRGTVGAGSRAAFGTG
ncbi:hypothetical protein RBB80_19055 [Tunturiibacter gelidiferens]